MDLEELLAKQSANLSASAAAASGATNPFLKKKSDKPSACGKCGYSGHLTFQCRNFLKTQPNKVH